MLSDTKARNAKPQDKAYRLTDDGGLHLFVTPAGAKIWRYRFDWAGKEQTLVIGNYPAVGLAEARDKRNAAKARLRDGGDPRVAPEVVPVATLREIATAWHAVNVARWAPHHATDVWNKINAEVLEHTGASGAVLGDMAIDQVAAPEVLAALRKLEKRSVETAHRLRGYLDGMFAFAIGEGKATLNPASMIKAAMAPMPNGEHWPAATTLDEAREVLRKTEGIPAYPITRLALRFVALTGSRPGEVAGLQWEEASGDLWRIPASRMKMKREHWVPLSRQAIEVLEAAKLLSGRMRFVFPSAISAHKPMSENAMNIMLRRAGLQGVHVPHGWRATFSTVMNERNRSDRHVIDLMLAHSPDDPIEAAYNRALHMERRREIAQEWADLLMDGFAPATSLIEGRRK